MASPHTRGWTEVHSDPVRIEPGFPAHAGMDPGRGGTGRGGTGLPRTRGDGPLAFDPDLAAAAASPHTRGWTFSDGAAQQEIRGFPAHAGMDPPGLGGAAGALRLPRTRGDGPSDNDFVSIMTLASPHTRGWTHSLYSYSNVDPGFPAHAGMDPRWSPAAPARYWLPRTRGDGPWGGQSEGQPTRASPHTRGWTLRPSVTSSRPPGFPAHAGMDPSAHSRGCSWRGLPRTRGDGPARVSCTARLIAASPHTRGWTSRRGQPRTLDVGFPAHAGMDPTLGRRGPTRIRLPRTRGDGPSPSPRSPRL